MLQGYGDTVLRTEALEEELNKARKHFALLQSKLDGAFAWYHNEVQEMQEKSDDLIRKNKSLHQKNKGMPPARLLSTYLGYLVVVQLCLALFAELETRVDQLKASETDLKNIVYREKDACEVLEYEYKQLSHECVYHMELREASDRDLVNYYKSLQKLNEDGERLHGQLKEVEEATLPIARLLVPHPGGPKIAPLVDQLKEAPRRLVTYVKHLTKSIPNQVLAYMAVLPQGSSRCSRWRTSRKLHR
jgi:FtsZ-binding cell division protein ZapB